VTRVSLGVNGEQGDGDSILPAISGNAMVIGFKSMASNLVPLDINRLVDVFVRRFAASGAADTELVSIGNRGGSADDVSYPPRLSFDGRFVSFGSAATNLVVGDGNGFADAFVRVGGDCGQTVLVSVAERGHQADGAVLDVPSDISGDGRVIAFASLASNLAAGDQNGTADVFVSANPFLTTGAP
jgi:hypothetical protein